MRKISLYIAGLSLLASGLTACGGSDSRWCEYDATDQVVADSFCEKNTPGYEWESGSKSEKNKKKKRTVKKT